jgi:hypothetical protein
MVTTYDSAGQPTKTHKGSTSCNLEATPSAWKPSVKWGSSKQNFWTTSKLIKKSQVDPSYFDKILGKLVPYKLSLALLNLPLTS